ncbi:MAG: glutathione S-transferase family protein [Synechococcales bacterium]|nr:glutathione S-transferase family protein [Synechococcales bacterium]
MIELYQFELSHYAEKVRFILDYKGLEYRKVEVTPGVGQIEVFQLSGQRQVPVLKDEGTVIADSTAIAEFLDRKYPEKPVIPTEGCIRGQALILEQWADEVFSSNARKGLLVSSTQNPVFRTAFLPTATPDLLKNLVNALPSLDFLGNLAAPVGLSADRVKDDLRQNLSWLCSILAEQPYLVGNQPTIADFAVAGLSLYIKFPTGNYLDLPAAVQGQGVPGIADNSLFDPFWNWRDRLYHDFRKGSTVVTFPTDGGGASRPTSISID